MLLLKINSSSALFPLKKHRINKKGIHQRVDKSLSVKGYFDLLNCLTHFFLFFINHCIVMCCCSFCIRVLVTLLLNKIILLFHRFIWNSYWNDCTLNTFILHDAFANHILVHTKESQTHLCSASISPDQNRTHLLIYRK